VWPSEAAAGDGWLAAAAIACAARAGAAAGLKDKRCHSGQLIS